MKAWLEGMLGRLAPGDRRAVLLGLAVIVPALLYAGAVRPYRAAVSERWERAAAERALLERERALLAQGEHMPATVLAAHERAQRASLRLVRAANVPLAEGEVTALLESMAALSRVLLQELRGVEQRRGDAAPGRGARAPRNGVIPDERLRPIRLSLRGESDLEGVLTFLQRVETSPLLMRVTELSLEPQYGGSARTGDRRTTGVISFSLVLEAYAPADIEQGSNGEVVP